MGTVAGLADAAQRTAAGFIRRVLARSTGEPGGFLHSVGFIPLLATAIAFFFAFCSSEVLADDPPPAPSATSQVGAQVTNPITNTATTVAALIVDPVGTPTAGNTAFVRTADGYVFLVKTVGEKFYNNDNPPLEFQITAISNGDAIVANALAAAPISFALGQTTVEFNNGFAGADTPGSVTPPEEVVGADGVKQVVYGNNGSNGRDGALVVPPNSGGDGAAGPLNEKTLTQNVNTGTKIGWEIGSVGGNGGSGGDSYLSFWDGRDGGDGGAGGRVIATQAQSSTIQTTGDNHHGIFAYSRSGKAGNGGSGFAAPGGGTGGHSSDGGRVTVNQHGGIFTNGTNAHGIYALSVSNNGGNGGSQWGLVGQAGSGGYGGNGGQVDVNTFAGAGILTEGRFSHGILAQSIGGTGGSAGTSGNLLVSLIGAADNGGNGGAVNVSHGGAIETRGYASRGIVAQSIGGGGGEGGAAAGLVALAMGGVGSNGGSGGAVSVQISGRGSIVTGGKFGDGVLAQSIGGSGGEGAQASGLISVGGNGSKGGDGSTVSVSNYGYIETRGEAARGIVAQSIGGGGGDGGNTGGMVAVGGSGAAGGKGSTVNVTNDGIIRTRGSDAMGILAQSIGGGGGNGSSAGAVGAFAGVAIGGTGGGGGAGGTVNVTLSNTDPSYASLIETTGDRSTGVFAQSVGGGGGNGGGAVSVAAGAFGAASISVGGEAGDGGAGGTVILTGQGDASVQTGGADAAGILLQSIGGGGGNGGYAISAAASAGPVNASLAVGVGGSGGKGGVGGEVRVGTLDGNGNLVASGFSGDVLTTGTRSAGMIFQSIGGGGGNGGLSVAASGGGSVLFSGNVSVGVGGSGGDGGEGGRVRVYTDANVTTTGSHSVGLLAQSVGGGGGNGGGSIAAGFSAAAGNAVSINVGVGGSGAAGSAGGAVDLIASGDLIRTTNQFSTGVIAQSIGGGGGNGGYTVAAGGAGGGVSAGAVNVGVGGSAGGGGAGGAVNARINAAVLTENDDSGAILIQSVGGGGGNGGFSVAAGAAGGGTGAGAVSVGLGGSGGAGGAGGAVIAAINGDVLTKGERSSGVVVQSIGGGGGNGGFSVSGTLTGAGSASGAVSVGLGGSGGTGGVGGTVLATVDGDVTTEKSDSTAILAQSVGGGGGNGGFNVSGTISGSGAGSGAISVGLGGGGGSGGDAGTVTLTNNGSVSTSGARSSGVVAQSIGGGGGNGGFNVSGTISGSGASAGSISVGLGGSGAGGGDAGAVNAISTGRILTTGNSSSGFVAQSIGGGGGNGGFDVSAALSFGGAGSGSIGVGLGGSGAGGGDGSTVTARTEAFVETRGSASIGILAQSVGGGGGSGGFNVTPTVSGSSAGAGAISVGLGGSGAGGGDGGAVDLTVKNSVVTRGAQSAAVVAQSIGGGGGSGGFNVSVAGTGAGAGSGAIGVGIGGRGGTGGNGGTVTSNVTGNLLTIGADSTGLLVQSVGGGGGNGGMNVSAAVAMSQAGAFGASVGLGGTGGGGGDAGDVESELVGNVATVGKGSSGVVVQSLGGGGGNGGLNVSGTVTASTTSSGGVSVGIGGSGGDGGNAGKAESTIEGNVLTVSDNSGGVLVQSAGGGGGNGGISVSGAVNLSSSGGGAIAVGLGGSGGGGGDASTAVSRMTGNVMTIGADASAFTVQSVGGGGGNGGLNVSGAISLAGTGSAAVGVGIGGFGGDGGNSADVEGILAGDVRTFGDRSSGVVVQSLGGGGGNGGLNVTGTISFAGEGSGSVGFGLGGMSGSGGNAGTAFGDVKGTIATRGEDATAVLVQSLGGGGGNGGLNVTGAVSVGGKKSGAAAIGVGGFGGDGGYASDVTGIFAGEVLTTGDRSAGVVAQSLGGGGGNGGINISAGLSVAKDYSGALGLGIGGFAGGGGVAGSVDHKVAGYVQTEGHESVGILTQSLGGGGGNGGLNVTGVVSLERQTGAAVGLGVGGFGGDGADAGALTASNVTGGVFTFGNRSSAIVTQSLGGGGGNGGINVSGAVNLSQENGGAATLGLGGFGGGGGNGGAVESIVRVADDDSITTRGDRSMAVLAQSVGGGGGTGGMNVSGSVNLTGKGGAAVALGVGGFGGAGGDASSVTLDVIGSVNTFGDRSHGLMAQSLGGGGGVGGTNISGALALEKPSGSESIFSIAAGVGGFGGGGGDAGAVSVSYSGTLIALPRTIDGDEVTINQTKGANGLVAQSIGGGGGEGGLNVSAGLAISSKPGAGQTDSKSYGVLVGVGGFGGVGGDASTVDVDVAEGSFIRAHGTGRSGILAQSVGGGGGNGGLNVSGGLVSDTSLIVGVGGMGGNAGRAGDVTVTARADIEVTTDPANLVAPDDEESFEEKLRDIFGDAIIDDMEEMVESKGLKTLLVDLGMFKGEEMPETEGSAGVLAQSIGGGGGNGGLNVSGGVAINKDGKVPSITFGIGGFGGAGSVSGDVMVDHAGTIVVEGNWKHGILAQSIAGGGGNGALNVTGHFNWGSSESTGGATDLSVVAGLGGHGGVGADAGDVEVISTGDIFTRGYHARGIFAQSVGGGGGTGGMNIAAVGTKDSTPVAIGIGGFGVSGGDAGNVRVVRGTELQSAGMIYTDGIGAHGIEASSIGGGGGDAGINAAIGISKTTGSGSNGGSKDDRKDVVHDGVDAKVGSNITDKVDSVDSPDDGGSGGGDKKTVNGAVIAIGGSAGNAGNGGDVEVEHFGNIVTVQDGSSGVFAQSVGGGGGNAVLSLGLIAATGDSSDNKAFGLAIGGGTGDGGNGGKVNLANVGDVVTLGDDSHGIFAQSIGGGGGNAGYNFLRTGTDGGNVNIKIGRVGGIGGSAGNVFARSNGDVITNGARSHGLFAQSIGNGGGNSSSVSVSLTAAAEEEGKDGDTYAVKVGLQGGEGGSAGNVTAEAAGLLYTLGDDSYGVFAQSVGGGGGNAGRVGGTAGTGTSFSVNIGGEGGTGGTSGDVEVTSVARVGTEGARAIGIFAQSVGGAGGTGSVIKGGTSALVGTVQTIKGSETGTTTDINIGGSGGSGMTSGDVTVHSGGEVSTLGDNAHGILAQSIGGGGGMSGAIKNVVVNVRSTVASNSTMSIGGSGGEGAASGDVKVTNDSWVSTAGKQAAGIYAQSVGGGGGDAQQIANIINGRTADNSARNALMIGGSSGTGGTAGTVEVINGADALIFTEGEQSHGIFAQSVGGGGGSGSDIESIMAISGADSQANTKRSLQFGLGGSGGTGGTGGTVKVQNDGTIVTLGDRAHGIIAQSIGGGGGNGGQSIFGSTGLRNGNGSDPTMALMIGGEGGSGNAAGNVTVTNTGIIDVSGSGSYGILAQSVGGGGGNGGMAASLSLAGLVEQAKGTSYARLAVGGAGGDGSNGGDVTVNHSGTIYVRGENAYGIFAQSVGGGGGNAGLSISTPAVMAADYTISTVLGAREGSNGTAGTVEVNSTGDILVTGAGSQAVFSQSVNGGGGNVETFLDLAAVTDAPGSEPNRGIILTSIMQLGGDAVNGMFGSDILQQHTGEIATTSDRSSGMMLQSIGGGGGNATTIVKGNGGTASISAMLGAINTSDAAGGNLAASRTGAVTTLGHLSSGGTFQSIGGGGGRLVVVGDPEAGGYSTASITLGADPSFLNAGGNVELELSGDLNTDGDHSSGQIVQSIGAGGGESYIVGLDQVTITLGATDGSSGDGGHIALSNTGNTATRGGLSHGFVIQSIGGGGGLVGTDLDASAIELILSTDNAGDGGDIEFTNEGYVVVTGDDAVGVLVQSLGGGGGSVDALYRNTAGGDGRGGSIALNLTGNILAVGNRGIAVMAQSAGSDGGDNIDIALDGVIIGGSEDEDDPNGAGAAGSTAGPAAIVMDGGADNSLSLSADSFLMAFNNRIISGGSGSDHVLLHGRAVGDIHLGGGVNEMTVSEGAAFYAQDQVDLGAEGLLHIDGHLYLGGVAYLADSSLTKETQASEFQVTSNVSQTTMLNGSISFGSTATYTPDVYFLQSGAAGGDSDLIIATEDATISGTVRPVLHRLDRALPLVLIDAGGLTADLGTQVIGTPVMSYSIGLNGPTGDGSTIDLMPTADFQMSGMNRNQTLAAQHINRVLTGQGSSAMGPMFALIANMETSEQVVHAVDQLMSEDYAATQVDALYSGYRFTRTMADCGYNNFAALVEDNRSCLWINGGVSSVERQPSFEYRSLDTRAVAFTGGVRMPINDDLYVGFGARVEDFKLTSGDYFSAEGKRFGMGVSLTKYQGPWEVYGILDGSTAHYETQRFIDIAGRLPGGDAVIGGLAYAKQHVGQANLRLGTAYRFQSEDSPAYLKPSLDFDASYLYSGAGSERNTDYGLDLYRTRQWIVTATPSLELGIGMQPTETIGLQAFVRGGVSFASKDDVFVNASFVGTDSSDGVFRNYSQIGDITGRLNAGLTLFSKDDTARLTLGYEGQWTKDTVGHTATANFSLRF